MKPIFASTCSLINSLLTRAAGGCGTDRCLSRSLVDLMFDRSDTLVALNELRYTAAICSQDVSFLGTADIFTLTPTKTRGRWAWRMLLRAYDKKCFAMAKGVGELKVHRYSQPEHKRDMYGSEQSVKPTRRPQALAMSHENVHWPPSKLRIRRYLPKTTASASHHHHHHRRRHHHHGRGVVTDSYWHEPADSR